ncbi:hypothetical protein GDO78_014582 [Eleutherodactylus coqui]|uniref:Uncharacterized protein n=1 Tax=Eleutherodactylus coqui TaxID=57060 RepID=A0A8J6BGQ3_ELECQ|nr:hypothetical protein GDO78_014582 [Eleutherodactylus coqui]
MTFDESQWTKYFQFGHRTLIAKYKSTRNLLQNCLPIVEGAFHTPPLVHRTPRHTLKMWGGKGDNDTVQWNCPPAHGCWS